MNHKKTSRIYNEVQENIDAIINKLESSVDDSEINEVKEDAIYHILKFKRESFLPELKSYQDAAESADRLSIAMYGETNAGKSTLIETLRIMLNEETKQDERQKYIEIQESISDSAFDEFKVNIGDIKGVLEEIEKAKAKQKRREIELESKTKEIAPQINQLQEQKANASFLYKLKALFGINPLKKEIKSLQKVLDDLQKEQENLQKVLEKYEEQKNKIEQKVDKLAKYCDGNIINKNTDHTRDVGIYDFEMDGKYFALYDLPGIEGSERKVIENIKNGLKKAHVVLYIKADPTPPQKGDKDKKGGTLEKIQEHLNPQSEVYAVFNKRVNSPSHPSLKGELINDGERKSLEVLDSKISEIMPDKYKGHKYLSAQPAFLAVAEYLPLREWALEGQVPREDKDKFMKELSVDEIMEKTNFANFMDFLCDNLLKDADIIMQNSALGKAKFVVENFVNVLLNISKKFETLYSVLNKEKNDFFAIMDSERNKMIDELGRTKREHIDNFVNKTQIEIYEYIKLNKKDSEVKDKLEKNIQKNAQNTGKEICKNFKRISENFASKLEEKSKHFKERLDKVMDESNFLEIQIGDHSFGFDTKSGFDIGRATATVLGAVGVIVGLLNVWNPFGWAIGAVGLAGVVLGAYKSVKKMFSEDYKMSEQRRVSDEAIRQCEERFDEKVSSEIKNIEEKIIESLDEAKGKISQMIDGFRESKELIESSLEAMNDLTKDIHRKQRRLRR